MGTTAAEIVSNIRKTRLISMNTLADLAGIPVSTISRIEAGKMEPTLSMLLRIAEATGFSLKQQIKEAGDDQPIAAYLDRLSKKGVSLQTRSDKELLTVASLAPVAKRKGARRVELTKSLKKSIKGLSNQGQMPIVSSLEAYNKNIETQQSFIPIIYIEYPEEAVALKAATPYSQQVMFVLPITDNVRGCAIPFGDAALVSPEWGIIDALASPGRQPDAALEVLALIKGEAV